jgi:hypothetical protein
MKVLPLPVCGTDVFLRVLKLDRKTLYRKLQRYGVDES